jgi:hypothetical protein
MMSPYLIKLLQKVQIVIKKQPQIIHVVTQHSETVEADAEGETGVSLGIDIHVFQHVGMHHTAAADFQPFAVFAHDVDFG